MEASSRPLLPLDNGDQSDTEIDIDDVLDLGVSLTDNPGGGGGMHELPARAALVLHPSHPRYTPPAPVPTLAHPHFLPPGWRGGNDAINDNDDEDLDSDAVGRAGQGQSQGQGRRRRNRDRDRTPEQEMQDRHAEIDQAIAAKRVQHETTLLHTIKELVLPNTYEALVDAKRQLEAGVIQFEAFCDIVDPILRNHAQIKKTLYLTTKPGTDKYIYTKPEQPVTLRPYVTLDDLILEWNTGGEGFSKVCTICLDNFKPPIRTLDCMHTFCKKCITEMLIHDRRGTDMTDLADLGETLVDITCPSCKQISFIGAEPRRQERVFNSMMESYLLDTLQYKCPFDCEFTFTKASIHKHMDGCMFRKYICDKGCREVLRQYNLHHDTYECVVHLQDKCKALQLDCGAKDDQIKKLTTEMETIKSKATAQASGSGSGKRRR